MSKKIEQIINEEMENFYTVNKTDDTTNIINEIIAELMDLNRGISYIPQGYEHKILDED